MNSKALRIAFCAVVSIFFIATIGIPAPKAVLEPVYSVEVAGSAPSACIGYDTVKGKWGEEFRYCPAGYAFYGVDDPGGPEGPANFIGTTGSCCPLPAADILTEEHVESEVSCPENYIATGTRNWECSDKKSCSRYMRCTKINTARYQLGEMTPGIYWGDGAAGWQGSQRTNWEAIPAGIRYSMGRKHNKEWDSDGCVGYPWGSLLAKKTSKYCSGMYFRQLQFAGIDGDPERGTPVKMFPDCDELENVNDPAAVTCINRS